jgi:hypothetical protein
MPGQGPNICLAAADLGDHSAGSPWVTSADGINPAQATYGTTAGGSNTCRFTMGANNFSLASAAVGVKVEIDWDMSNGFTPPGTVTDIEVQLTSGGSQLGTSNLATNSLLPTTLTFVAYGDATNEWGFGGSIPTADINDSTFGVDVRVSNGTDPNNECFISQVRITAYEVIGDAWIPIRKRRQRDMGQIIKQNQSAEPILFFMADSSDHITGKTGLSPAVELGKNGGVGAAPSGAISEVDSTNLPGWYKVAGNSTDSNTLGPLVLKATATGADPADDRHQVVAYDPRDGVRMGQAALPNADAEAAGGLFTRGMGAGQVNQDANGRLDINLAAVAGDTATSTIMKALYGSAVVSGTVNSVTNSGQFTLTSTGLSSNDNDYNGMWLIFTSGSNKYVPRLIGTYTGSSKQVAFTGNGRQGAFPETVSASDSWLILAGAVG